MPCSAKGAPDHRDAVVVLVAAADAPSYSWGRTKACGAEPGDPPLSATGHKQAAEAAACIVEQIGRHRLRMVLTSPHLCAIETALHLVRQVDFPLHIAAALASLENEQFEEQKDKEDEEEDFFGPLPAHLKKRAVRVACKTPMPSRAERFRYFPEVDVCAERLAGNKAASAAAGSLLRKGACGIGGHDGYSGPGGVFAGRLKQGPLPPAAPPEPVVMEPSSCTVEEAVQWLEKAVALAGDACVCFLRALPDAIISAMLKRMPTPSERPGSAGVLVLARHPGDENWEVAPTRRRGTAPTRAANAQLSTLRAPPKDSSWALLFLVRHGDRFDYKHEGWKSDIAVCGGHYRDPPLSTLGFDQSEELGAHLAAQLPGRQTTVLSSPYLRAIQTALPLARRLGTTVHVEEGLAEIRHGENGPLAPLVERCRYMPEVDVAYKPLYTFPTRRVEEGWPVESLERMRVMSKIIDSAVGPGEALVCFSHAASVAIVAALQQTVLTCDLVFAPAGVFALGRPEAGAPWQLLESGSSNKAHISSGSGSTESWGYKDRHLDKWLDECGERFPDGYPL